MTAGVLSVVLWLDKEISPKMCILCVRVVINKRFFGGVVVVFVVVVVVFNPFVLENTI